jgi:beta-galactosidase
MNKLAENNISAVLATPSGARPAWMSAKYPEVLRVTADRVRNLHGQRHNHCYTSPVYRKKTLEMNKRLAERYKKHPALILWHISNEYGGECHCELCQDAFRSWLKKKYDNDLDKLNKEWWTAFWSHTYTDWTEIESPSQRGESSIHGLNIDWKRFVTYQTVDFMKNEIKPIKEITPNIPVTTNFMGFYPGLNYWKFKDVVDVVSWDNYPEWHLGDDIDLASYISFTHEMNRSIKRKPFLLIESTPSNTNWQKHAKLKKPGMHFLSSMQAVANGADSVMYFQWRKGRGAWEKFHGAVVDHAGHEHTRVFEDVTQVGDALKKLDAVTGSVHKPEVAVIYDWENRWAIDDLGGLNRNAKKYLETCHRHYLPFWKMGIPADVINETADISGYKLVIAPMLYMLRNGLADRLEQFVKNGGTLAATFLSGQVNENDLCFLGGFPGPLRKLLGIWSEEIDCLTEKESNGIVFNKSNELKMTGEYKSGDYCEIIHAETAEVLAKYKSDFYKGMPAVTVNYSGNGKAYYIASRNDDKFNYDLYSTIAKRIGLKRSLNSDLPEGVTASARYKGKEKFLFLMNFGGKTATVDLKKDIYTDMITERKATGIIRIPSFAVKIFKTDKPV